MSDVKSHIKTHTYVFHWYIGVLKVVGNTAETEQNWRNASKTNDVNEVTWLTIVSTKYEFYDQIVVSGLERKFWQGQYMSDFITTVNQMSLKEWPL